MPEKKQRFSNFLIRGSFVYNPVLIQALGLCLVIAATTSLKVSLLLSAVISVTLIISEALTALFIKKFPNWVRVTVYMLIGLTVACPLMLVLERVNEELLTAAGVYLPLISVNAIVAVRCERYATKHELRESLFDGIASSIGFSVVMILVGIIREIIGSGSIGGKALWNAKMPGMLLPFGGLIVLGFMSALAKSVIAKVFPQNSSVIKNMDKPIIPEKPPETNTMTAPPVKARYGGKHKVTEVGVHTVSIKDTVEKLVKNVTTHYGEDDLSAEETVSQDITANNKKRRKNKSRKNRRGKPAYQSRPYAAPEATAEDKNISELLEEMDKEYNVTATGSNAEKAITPEEIKDIDPKELKKDDLPDPDVDLSHIRIGADRPKSSADYMESFSSAKKPEDGEGQPQKESKPYSVDSHFEEILKKYHLD